MIDIEVEDDVWSADVPDVEGVVARAAEQVAPPGDVVILLTDDETVRDLNGRFRGKDRPTNVLSFPPPENARPHLGDIVLAYGASLLRRGQVDRLVITRPAVEAGEKLGFLPGDLNEKVDPYLAPIWEALNEILGADDVRRRRDKGEIEAAPIAFMRGRTLSHAFVIADEAQNLTRLQMKMVLTRLGEGARMVVTGDPSQVDLVNTRDSGLPHALRILENVKGVGVLRFEAADVVRHAMVERIVRAYDADAAAARGGDATAP